MLNASYHAAKTRAHIQGKGFDERRFWIKHALGFTFILFSVATFILLSAWSQGALAWEGRVTNVTDGDTFDIERGQTGEEVTIRLYGIDTPESDQPHGEKATQALENLIGGEMVEIEKVEIGHYGRTIALAYEGGRPINEELVRLGHAWVYDRYCDRAVCRGWDRMESRARKKERGLWASQDPVPPWEWRN